MFRLRVLMSVFSGCLIFASGAMANEQIKSGGTIRKLSEKNYRISILYRDGRKAETDAVLVEKTVASGSVKAIYRFLIEGCGNLEFIQPPSGMPAILAPDSEYFASQEADCPINFGGAENRWIIK